MRIHLVFAAMAVVLFSFAISRSPGKEFTFETLVAEAREIAAQPYRPAESPVPKFLREIGYDQYRDLRYREEHTLWRSLGRPFQARFFHPGYFYNQIVEFYEIDGERIAPIRYSPEQFSFEHSSAPMHARVPKDLGYAGFRVHYPINAKDRLDEVISFLGASYFRALGKDHNYGLSARGLAVNPGTDTPEEFPSFTKFWLRRPQSYDRVFQFYGLLESDSVTGAYEFWLEPGETTRLRIKARLFVRKKNGKFGLAPLTSMFWFGENTSNTFGDARPEVHDSDGLLVYGSKGEWTWRPLAWANRTQMNVFQDARGFGLLQRDRDFTHYQDLEAKYHLRPSVWTEFGMGWPEGDVHLVQFHTRNEYNDNVVAYWTPRRELEPGEEIELSYVLHWFAENAQWPSLGRCFSTRIDSQEEKYFRQFFLDFAGDRLKQLKSDAGVKLEVSTSDNAVADRIAVQKNDFDQSWRASFMVSTPQSARPIELRCALKNGDEILTETWTYTWLP